MDNKTKKIISEEWLKAFPSLKAYSQNKFYKIIGPFICGIELINLPRSTNYRPHFVMYPLYKIDIKSCLEYPVLMFEFYDKKKNQLNLPYDDANRKFIEAQNIVSKNLPFSIEDNMEIDFFNLQIENIISNSTTYTNMSYTRKQAIIFELRFYTYLYVGNKEKLNTVMSEIQANSKSWDLKIFEKWRGNYDSWFKDLQEKINCREEFLEIIETNKQDKKIAKLNSSEIV